MVLVALAVVAAPLNRKPVRHTSTGGSGLSTPVAACVGFSIVKIFLGFVFGALARSRASDPRAGFFRPLRVELTEVGRRYAWLSGGFTVNGLLLAFLCTLGM